MSTARKCDRCLKCFDPGVEKEEMMYMRNPVFQTCEEVKAQTIKRQLKPGNPDAIIDFCPSCTKEFQKWMMKPIQDDLDEAIEKGMMKEQQDTFEKVFEKHAIDIKDEDASQNELQKEYEKWKNGKQFKPYYYAKADDMIQNAKNTFQEKLNDAFKKFMASDKSDNEKLDYYQMLSALKRMVFNVYDNR